MKATTSKILLSLTILVVAFSLSITVANADVLYSQTNSASQTTAASLETYQSLGTGLSGYITGYTFRIVALASASQNYALNLVECNTATVTSAAGLSCSGGGAGTVASASYILNVAAGTFDIEAVFTTAYVLNSSKYYFITFGTSGAPDTDVRMKGSSSDTYTNGSFNAFSSGGSTSPVLDAYFILNGQIESSNTRIISLNTPIDGEVTATQAVNFQFTYYSNPSDLYTTLGVSLVDVSSSQSVVGATSTVAGSGQFTASLTRFLSSGHQYRWTAYLQKANGQRITSQSRTFYVVSTPSFSSSTASIVPIDQITEANASSTILQTLNQTLNIFSLLGNKVPFVYFFLVYGTLNWDNVPATSQAGEVALDLGDVASSSIMFNYGRVVIFSTTTVSTYLGPYLTPIRALCDVVLYVTTGLALFAMRRQIFV